MSQIQLFSKEEISKHNQENDLWVIINGKVWDLSKFSKIHPGGKGVLLNYAGQDCTKQFYGLHQEKILQKYQSKLVIGHVKDEEVIEIRDKNQLSEVPYGESSAFTKGFYSPYFKESHLRYKLALRKWIETNLTPYVDDWEEQGTIPSLELIKKMGDAGILACQLQPGPHLKGFKILGDVQPEEFDYFHEMITHQELTRIGNPGIRDSFSSGLVIGLPPVQNFAKKQVKDKVVNEVLTGQKRICLAITDPNAGSDVANLTCVAKLSECKQYYIVNGTKKWITNGTFADYFVTAVRTGDEGIFGISMLLIERSQGLETKPIKTSYSPAAGTAYVTYTNVKVPVENLLGEENRGFEIIMSNFNHERWMICVGLLYGLRFITEQCMMWSNQREAFGKKLIEQPVIRNKLGIMIAQIEALENWAENITFQMNSMDYRQQFKYLGGPIALLKLQITRSSTSILDNACQIFGGRSITRTGMGMHIEKFQKSFKFGSILGGSEEIMADLGIKQAQRVFPQKSKL